MKTFFVSVPSRLCIDLFTCCSWIRWWGGRETSFRFTSRPYPSAKVSTIISLLSIPLLILHASLPVSVSVSLSISLADTLFSLEALLHASYFCLLATCLYDSLLLGVSLTLWLDCWLTRLHSCSVAHLLAYFIVQLLACSIAWLLVYLLP